MVPARLLWALLAAAAVGCASEPGAPATAGRQIAHAPVASRDPDASRRPVAEPAPPPAPTPAPPPLDPWAGFHRAVRAVLDSRASRADSQPGAIVRVAHLGDSHTASDALTGRLRKVLQGRIGDAGHGFVVPGWDASRLHRGVRLGASGGWIVERVKYLPALAVGDRLFGLGAASVRSARQGETFSVQATASSFDLYYLGVPGGGSFDVRIDGGPAERVSTAADARAARFHRIEVPDGRHELTLEIAGDAEVRLFGVEIERTGPGLIYSSLGVGGARVTTPLEWDEELFRRQLERMRPDLVVMMYGTNDLYADDFTVAGFREGLERLVARIHAAVPGASCLVLAPPDVARPSDSGMLQSIPELVALVEAEREAAERAGCAFWDTLADMGGPGSIIEWRRQRPSLAARDHVHLTAPGYERLADAIARELLRRAAE